MSIKISQLPPKVGNSGISTGEIPISIAGITFKVIPSQLLTGTTSGIGTNNFVTKWNGTSSLTNSLIFDNGTNVGVDNTTPTSKFHVNGFVTASGYIIPSGTSSQFLKADGTVDSKVYITGETDTLQTVTTRGAITTNNITANSFIKSGGTSSQFLKADGSIDSNTYQIAVGNPITGTGTTGIVPRFGSSSSLEDSHIIDTGGTVTIDANMFVNETLTANTFHTENMTIGIAPLTADLQFMANASVSTGLYEFTNGGIVATGSTTFNVGSVKGWIIPPQNILNTQPITVNYSGGSGLTTPYLLTSPSSYLLINSASTLTILPNKPTVTDRRNMIFLGVIGHPTGTFTGVGNSPDILMNELSQVREMFEPTRLINEGVSTYPNSTNMTLANTAGLLYGFGIGFVANGNFAPSVLSIAGGSPTTFQYRTQTGQTFANTTLISGGTYDVAGVATAVPGSPNQATNQRAYLLQNGIIRIQFGQQIYATLTDAISASQTEAFIPFANAKLGILVGIICVTKGCINLADTTTARFLNVSKFGETVGAAGGIAVGTLQTSYNNSTEPEILTNTTLNAVSIRRGSAADTDNVLQIQNGAATSTFYVTGNGGFTASTDSLINSITVGRGSGNVASNTAFGNQALFQNSVSSNITAVGFNALRIVSGSSNTAFGSQVLSNLTTGTNNTGVGIQALLNLITGTNCIGIGNLALSENQTGSNSIGIGSSAGRFLLNGVSANTTATDSIFIGSQTRSFATAQSNQIVIGDSALGLGTNTVTLGNDSITKTALKGTILIGTTANTTSDKVQIVGSVLSTGFVKSGGTSNQYLMADGSTSVLINNVTGTGSSNRLAKFSTSTQIADSNISDNGTLITLSANTNAISGLTANTLNINTTAIISGRTTCTGGFASQRALNTLEYALRDNISTNVRWAWYRTNTETGSTSGSDFVMSRYDDAGSNIGNAYQIRRTDGLFNFEGSRMFLGGSDNGTDKLQVSGTMLATTIKKSGAIASDHLMGDGSVQTYKEYTAVVNTTGATIEVIPLLNTVGSIVWTNIGTGRFLGTLTGAFANNKCVFFINPGNGGTIGTINFFRNDDNTIQFNTYITTSGALANDIINRGSLRVQVFP